VGEEEVPPDVRSYFRKAIASKKYITEEERVDIGLDASDTMEQEGSE